MTLMFVVIQKRGFLLFLLVIDLICTLGLSENSQSIEKITSPEKQLYRVYLPFK